MKRIILIVSILAGVLLLTAGGITGYFLLRADGQEEEKAENASPEIFFHVHDTISTDININIEDGVTLTRPEIENGKSASWQDLCVDVNGNILYNEAKYQYLYYEGRFIHLYGDSCFGWQVMNIDDELYFKGAKIYPNDLVDILNLKFLEAGLQSNEADVLIERIIDNDMLSFSSKYLIIKYIPMEQVNQAIDLSATYDIEIVRRHFLIIESEEENKIEEPEFEVFNKNEEYLMETAINRI